MMAGSSCDCLVCQLEKNLVAELRGERASNEYRLLAASSVVLSRVPSALDLIEHLHAPGSSNHGTFGDLTLVELLEFSRQSPAPSIWQHILLLVFIPTIHRTASQIAGTFPSLARDDISQHALATLLEFFGSRELATRRSHIAFTIARKLRRLAFRWAIRESRGAARDDTDQGSAGYAVETLVTETPDAGILLNQFLDACQRAGWISLKERLFLTQLKIEGLSCQELARRNGHSAIAIQHRMQRLLDRLRRFAKNPPTPFPEQLELFER